VPGQRGQVPYGRLKTRCLLVLLSLAPLPASAEARLTYDPLLKTIVHWLAANFSLSHAKIPALVSVPPKALVEMRYGSTANVAIGEILAVYDQAGPTIYLSSEWSGGSPAEVSVVVHEMVHHLQSAAGVIFACPNAREELAYRAQDAWLGLFGESLESAFGLDEATLKILAVCTH
jgi:hypothetical protein